MGAGGADEERSTLEELRRLDPTLPVVEFQLGRVARNAGDLAAALAHFTRCNELSAKTGCLSAIATLTGDRGECERYLEELRRATVVDPDDAFLRMDVFHATLGARRSYEEALAALEAAKAKLTEASGSPPDVLAYEASALDRDLAVWFGAFEAARRATNEMTAITKAAFNIGGVSSGLLSLAEEEGAEAQTAALLRSFVSNRGVSRMESGDDGVALEALGRHQVFSADAIARLREGWRAQATSKSPDEIWFSYDALPAVTRADARAALALRGDGGSLPFARTAAPNAVIGRLFLLAGQNEDAAPYLERAGSACRTTTGDAVIEAFDIVRAELDLGRAREALGDIPRACAAYGRVLERWGHATPRSVTAEAARSASSRLHCPG
jgi:serine/threonine-protein kinase